MPDSGLDAALGYARQSGIPYGIGFIKNKYIGRTFISPTQTMRENEVNIKLNPIRSVVEGKRVVLIDDSIVRGTTCRRTIDLLWKAGAKEIHMRVSAPPFVSECYYGTDIDDKNNLIATHHTVDEIAKIIGVNHRNLKDFSVDFSNAARLRDLIPPEAVYVAESGVQSAQDVAALRSIGADAVLIGETLMRASDKARRLAELRGNL